jgi:hypothetical protein
LSDLPAGMHLSVSDGFIGVLKRHESLAANLGAKLVGPLLVKSVEKLFEGPIKILQSQYGAEGVSITWLDIIDFAGTKPNSFMLSDSTGGGRVCQFWIKNCLVQISEDDYRLVLSGAPERMIPTQPIPEDEIAELGTMEILEQRLAVMIRKADLVAGRARQLNYHLKGRKTAIQARRGAQQSESILGHGTDSRQSSTPFQAINNRSSGNGEAQAFHQDLLRQFQSEDRKPTSFKTKANRAVPDSNSPTTPSHQGPKRHSSQSHATVDELVGGQYRPTMMARMEKLARGEPIWPPCDRCRRLRMDCTKYLTACAGCTKKHAKCSWNDITEEEIVYINGSMDGGAGSSGAAEGDSASNGAQLATAADLNANLDPGLRSGVGGGQGNDEGGGGRNLKLDVSTAGPRGNGRNRETRDAESFLSQMASTAGAAATQ